MKNFRTYEDSVQFYHLALEARIPRHLKDHLLRAASSISLNLAEGYGRLSVPDRQRFYRIALGSLRECQAILRLTTNGGPLDSRADRLGACLYRLCTWRE